MTFQKVLHQGSKVHFFVSAISHFIDAALSQFRLLYRLTIFRKANELKTNHFDMKI